MKICKKHANRNNGTIFLKDYPLKNITQLTCNLDNEDLRSDRIFDTTLPVGTLVQINVSNTLSGNYATIVWRDNVTCRLYEKNLEKDEANKLVEKYFGDNF